MPKLIALVALLFVVPSLLAAEPTSQLRIKLDGLAEVEGNIFVTVYDSKDTWLGESALTSRWVAIDEARDGDIVVVDFQLPPGEYALSIYYDANNNQEMDTNFIGIPKEPVALSNNARPRFGPPKYKDAVFSLGAEQVVQQISMTVID